MTYVPVIYPASGHDTQKLSYEVKNGIMKISGEMTPIKEAVNVYGDYSPDGGGTFSTTTFSEGSYVLFLDVDTKWASEYAAGEEIKGSEAFTWSPKNSYGKTLGDSQNNMPLDWLLLSSNYTTGSYSESPNVALRNIKGPLVIGRYITSDGFDYKFGTNKELSYFSINLADTDNTIIKFDCSGITFKPMPEV